MNPAQQKLALAASLYEYILHATSENARAAHDRQLQEEITKVAAETACDLAATFMRIAAKKFGFPNP